jgi:hypothetical protein
MEDRKLMVAELKMVCTEHLCRTSTKFKQPKPVDAVTAIRQRIESLTTREQLDHLSEAVKEKYVDVFSEIPHISKVQSRRFTVDSAEASTLNSGTNFWVR